LFNQAELYKNFLSEWAKLYLLSTIIGQGMSSRLWTKCVDEEMLLERAECNITRFSTKGYFLINASGENSQFSFGLESILQILESLKKTTVSINELSKAKELLKGKLILEQEDLLSATIWQVEQSMFGLAVNLQDFLESIQQIQAAELRSLACELFVSRKLALLILGPNKESRLIERLTEKYLS
jgi:predicted Zn-dependent peptidase